MLVDIEELQEVEELRLEELELGMNFSHFPNSGLQPSRQWSPFPHQYEAEQQCPNLLP